MKEDLLKLYELTKLEKQDYGVSFSAAYYRKKDSLYKEYFENRHPFEKPCLELFVFLILFSHNTTDTHTYNTFKTIHQRLKEKNLEIQDLKNFFYKKKEKYYQTMVEVSSYLRDKETKNQEILLKELLEYPYIGLKSASLILNHFSQKIYPVVDVNVQKAYNILLRDNKNPDQIYFELNTLNYHTGDDYAAYDLANWLWEHRKNCRKERPYCSNKKNSYDICEVCKKYNKYIKG